MSPPSAWIPRKSARLRKLIADLAGEHTVLLCTHILQEVEAVCQKVIIIGRGRVLAEGTPEDLKNRGGGAIRVEIRGPNDQIRAALTAIPGIDKVDTLQTGPVGSFHLRAKNAPEVREQIAAMVSQRGWSLREMRLEGTSLEEFFVRVTDPGAAAA